MTESATTLRAAFALPQEGVPDHSPDRWKTLQERLARNVATIKWPAAMPDLAPKVCNLFDVEIPDLLLVVWKSADGVRLAMQKSRETPDKVFEAALADHELKSELHPHIDVMLEHKVVRKIEFTLQLKFTLKGGVLEFKGGVAQAMRLALCELEGALVYDKLKVAELPATRIPLSGRIELSPEQSRDGRARSAS